MKRTNKITIMLLLTAITSTLLVGCEKISLKNRQPDILQIRNIANLSTLECYYHNVAKSEKSKGTGISNVGEMDRKFWIEYTGVVKLGIDMSQIEMEIDENNITITIPQAKVLGVTIDEKSWNEESIIASEDGINPNKIESEDVTLAINIAQEKMKETAESNATMLNNAQMRAKSLIENYINKLGEITETKYTINWKYLNQTSE